MIDLKRYGSVWDRNERINQNDNLDTIEKIINDRGVEILSDSAFLTWLDENGIKHREEVATVADLPTNDSLNTVRGVADSNKIYIKKENGWVSFQTIDISKINEVERAVEAISYAAPLNTFSNIADGINAFYQSLPDGAWMKIPAGEHVFDKTIVFDREINVDLTGAIMTYEGPTTTPALIIGKEEGSIRHFNIVGTYIRREGIDKYADPSEVGIKIINVSYSKIDLSVFSFYRGVEITSGNSKGNVYNQYNLGWIYNNFEGIVLTVFDETGWTNENNFYGGSFALTSDSSTPDHRHVVIEHKHGYRNNNNRFYGPSFEDGGFQAIAIDCDGASTYFYGGRYEGASRVIMGENALDNVIMHGFGSDQIEVTGKKLGLTLIGNRKMDINVDTRGINIRPTSSGGKVLNIDFLGTDIFNVGSDGSIKGRSIEILNRIFLNGDRAIGVSTNVDNFPHSIGSLFMNAGGGYNGLKYKVFGAATSTSGWKDVQLVHSASQTSRPGTVSPGFTMFDTSLGKPIWWNGVNWVDALGDIV